ncbi:Aldehyde/histidinol dehydrogenase [Haematococcus lacustris]
MRLASAGCRVVWPLARQFSQAAHLTGSTAQASELASAGRMSSCTDQILGRLRDPSLLHAAGLIDGEWTAGLDGGPKFQVFNPANGKLLATLPSMKRDECRAAIAAADVAFAAWSARTAKERAQVLMRWHAQILEHSEDLASVMTLECGKPVGESRAEIASGAGSVEWFAEECKRVTGDVLEPSNRDRRMVVLKQPVGVVGAITPWNFPMSMITRKVAPALAAGCTVVLKPSELTPLTALVLAELAQRAGLPPGCINIVFGDPSAIGQELTSNQAVRKIGFTGSTAVGKALAAAASATVKRVSLELGGNAPLIVFKDADLELAAEGAVKSALRNAGQTCICTNRVHVHTSVYDKFAELVVARVKALRLGDGLEAGVTLGPLVSAAGRDKVAAHVEDAVAKGGRVLTGGSRPAPGSGLDAGTFFEPTVIVDSTIDMRCFKEETFGPLVPLFRFDSESEAVQLANDTEYGLAAYFYTRDLAQAWRVAEQLQYGMIGVNEVLITHESAPFGGMKQSGIGREQSKYGLAEFMDIKYVCMGLNYQ